MAPQKGKHDLHFECPAYSQSASLPLYLSTDKVSIMQEDSSTGPSRGLIQAGLSSPKGFWGQEGKLCEGLRVRWCFLDLEMRA